MRHRHRHRSVARRRKQSNLEHDYGAQGIGHWLIVLLIAVLLFGTKKPATLAATSPRHRDFRKVWTTSFRAVATEGGPGRAFGCSRQRKQARKHAVTVRHVRHWNGRDRADRCGRPAGPRSGTPHASHALPARCCARRATAGRACAPTSSVNWLPKISSGLCARPLRRPTRARTCAARPHRCPTSNRGLQSLPPNQARHKATM